MIAPVTILLLAALGLAATPTTSLDWGTPKTVEAPNHLWLLVIPGEVKAEKTGRSALMVNAKTGHAYSLWDFDRHAEVSWRPDSGALLIVTEYPRTGHVGLAVPGEHRNPFVIDKLVWRDMQRRVPSGMEFLWFNPRILRWLPDGSAEISVGTSIVPSKGGSGRDGECRRLRIAAAPDRIVSSVAVDRREWKAICPGIVD